jgi:hypothetical protein
MTKFEDRLLEQLIAEHGHQLRAQPPPQPAPTQPAPTRRRAGRRARRPVWLATAAAAITATITAAVMAAGSTPAAAYSVTRHDGTVTVSVYRLSGVAGANAALHAMHAPVVVVPVRPSCPPIGSLPRPRPAPHPGVWVKSGVGKNGHRSVTVKLGNGGIPHGDTMILAFTGNPHTGGAVGAGGIITGPVPHCVSLPPPPSGGSGVG